MTTSKIMFDKEERNERMQMNLEASNACFMTKASSFSSGEVRNSMVFSGINFDNIPANLAISEQSITGEASGATYLGYSTPVYHQDVLMWPGFYSNALMQHNNMNAFNSHFYLPNQEYIYPVENRNHLPLKMVTHNYPLEGQLQEFQYFVVIDFEATCDKDKSPDPQEIIEFPSVLVNSMTGELEASFQTYVRPTYHTALSDFCKQLTGIQQLQVDRGVSLSEALLMHDKWLEEKGIKNKNFAIVTWSNWDCRVMLESECKLKRIRKPPYFNRCLETFVAI
ncbi:hypothetical protein HPP92_020811 [Vanilla planifolia]|uniref:Exonuclease domain-containing protein n=1 Tax=Vanilla planifolia TaxID=51239 RepID=A0A835PXR4_VANPL|nr:hypothetical protein HPP92_020811 [Vanilla planifolia]